MRIKSTLGPEAVALVTQRQREQQTSWRNAPDDGYDVAFAGERFIVYPGVFPPRSDTELLRSNLRIPQNAKVLDVGTGSGALAVAACRMGASHCLALDISRAAVQNARVNAERLGVSGQMDVRLSDTLDGLQADEAFDVVIANLPGRAADAADDVESAQWDTGFRTHRRFFDQVGAHLAAGGHIIMTKANYPEINDVLAMAEGAGLAPHVVAERPPHDGDPRTYYALVFTRHR